MIFVVAQSILKLNNLVPVFVLIAINLSIITVLKKVGTSLPQQLLTITYLKHRNKACHNLPKIDGILVVAQSIILPKNLPLDYSIFLIAISLLQHKKLTCYNYPKTMAALL